MNRLTTLACCLALPVALTTFACGGDGGTSADPDTSVSADTTEATDTATAADDTTELADTDPTPQADIVGPGDTGSTYVPEEPNYPATCTDTGFNNYAEQFATQQGVQIYQAVTTTKEPYTALSFEFYGGEFGGATSPGTYDLNGSNYETCGNCVVVRTGCSAAAGGCEKTYYADAGELVIDRWEVGGKFEGHLQDVVLKEVTIDPETYHSTPVAGGGEWCLDEYVFSADVAAPLVGGENTQPVCVEEGTGTLVNDNVANYSLPNCLGKQVTLHDSCGKKAVWMIGTAGWCTACHELLTAMVSDYGGSLTRAKVDARYPGLDLLIILGENQYGSEPSQAYCKAYAEDLGIDPAMVLIDHNPDSVDIPLVDPQGYALPVESFATTWENINPYLVAEGETVTTSTPWHIVLRGSNMEYMWSDNVGAGTLDGTLNQLLNE